MIGESGTEFELSQGNWTKAGGKETGFYGPIAPISPPNLLHLRFGSLSELEGPALTVAVAKNLNGKTVQRLWVLQGRKWGMLS